MEVIERITKSTNSRWYVAFTAPHAEQRMLQELKTKGLECTVPLCTCTIWWGGRIIRKQVPRFSRCIFVRICQEDIYELSEVPGLLVPSDIRGFRDLESFCGFVSK